MKRWIIGVLVLTGLLLSACEGGGSASMTRQSCNTNNIMMAGGSVTCTGGARTVKGRYGINLGDGLPDGTYDVTASFSVEEGTATLYWIESEQDALIGDVSSGQPLVFEGPAKTRTGSLGVRVVVQGGEGASINGFSYEVTGVHQ